MDRKSTIWLRTGEWLLNRRWWWIALASLSVFMFEYMEYQPFQPGWDYDIGFFFETLFYGVVLPVSTGLALTWLAASRAEMARSIYYQTLKRNLDLQINSAPSHTKLAEATLEFIKLVIPLLSASLYKYDLGARGYTPILYWPPDKIPDDSTSIANCSAADCPCLIVKPGEISMTLHPCRDPKVSSTAPPSECFCAPVLFSGTPVAGARLYVPSGSPPLPEQVQVLQEAAPEIGAAFHRVQLERLMKRQGDQINSEQKRIARDVHDTLGHSLAYLRLRLDQMSTEFNVTETSTLQQEVITLRDIAKEAYEQMRDMLITLTPIRDLNMNDTLEKYAARVSKRAKFDLNIRNFGKPRLLPPPIQRNVINIFREILTNIENHAHATQVDLAFNWRNKDFEIKVDDNGVGFDPALPVQYGHFGLGNMRERAVESNARLSISSQPGRGTHITLSFPYEDKHETVDS